MKVYFCGSIRGGRDDVELYLRIVTKLQSFATVLTEHVSKRELGDTGQTTLGTKQCTEYCQSPLYYTEYSQYYSAPYTGQTTQNLTHCTKCLLYIQSISQNKVLYAKVPYTVVK